VPCSTKILPIRTDLLADGSNSTTPLEHSQPAESRLLPLRPHILRIRRDRFNLQRPPLPSQTRSKSIPRFGRWGKEKRNRSRRRKKTNTMDTRNATYANRSLIIDRRPAFSSCIAVSHPIIRFKAAHLGLRSEVPHRSMADAKPGGPTPRPPLLHLKAQTLIISATSLVQYIVSSGQVL